MDLTLLSLSIKVFEFEFEFQALVYDTLTLPFWRKVPEREAWCMRLSESVRASCLSLPRVSNRP